MSKEELSLLIFLESCHVDYGGPVNAKSMNADDFSIAKRWNDEGFIEFGRIWSGDLERYYPKSHWVVLSGRAMDLAHGERKERGKRMIEERTWRKTSEA